VCASGHSGAGHSVGHYPSYYPDEIRIEAIDPAAAGKALVDETLHAYVGAVPDFAHPVSRHVKSAKSLGSYLVLSFDMASARFASARDRCAAARGTLAALGEWKTDEFVFLPYPVTPYHADYLHHLDRIEVAKAALDGGSSLAMPAKIGAKGRLAERIVAARWGTVATGADAVLEVVTVEDLLAAADVQVLSWSGPPWVKEGWFQAHRLLASGLDAVSRLAVDGYYDLLMRGEIRDLVERTDLERQLVAALTSGCERVVMGYAVKEEFFNEAYPAGVENVAYDSMSGLNSPIFIRTVKLKDYPWNGKLRLGVRERSDAAWNPVGGFTDAMGRLLWSAVGDPAMIAFPDNASWMPNRVQSQTTKVVGRSGGVKVPADAIRLEAGSGALQRVGDRAVSSAKVVYDVLASPFGDGTEMSVADVLYPYSFAYRWGSERGDTHEPDVAAAYAALRERLVALKVVRVDKTTHPIAEGLNVIVTTPVVEVYLKDAPGDDQQLAALAPPWSAVPWHLLVLMEEAVARNYAAFSQDESVRRGVPWLDLVRDAALRIKLQDLMAEFERASYRPLPLEDFVSAEEAQARWRALRAFSEKNGHLLVTNGPYGLKEWSPEAVVLDAVREITYPLGFGTFDRFVNPPRAVIEAVAQDATEITVRAGAEMILKAGREYQVRKEPLLRTTARGVNSLLVVSRYVLVDPDGKVLKVDKMQWREDGLFSISIPEGLPAGRYAAFLAIFLDGNSLLPSTSILHFDVGAADSRR
jgi:hypothetical protein